MDLERPRNQISFYIAKDKHLALAEKLGFFFGCQMVAKWLPRRLKTRLPKQLQAA